MINLFVVSRFASTTNRRINHLLDLTGEGARTHVVRQRHGKAERQIQHSDTVDVDLRARGFYPLNVAMALIASLELGMLGSFPLSISVYLGALKRGLFAALRQADRRGESSTVVIVVPPPELVVLAPAIRRRFPKVTICIDWQDLWSPDDYYVRPGDARHGRIVGLERAAMDAADLNITSNPKALAAQLRLADQAADGPGSERFLAIGHAYEGERAPMRTPPRGAISRPRRLVFMGNLFKPPKVPGDMLVAELGKAIAAGADLELVVIGDHELSANPAAVAALPPFVKAIERTSHEEAVSYLQDADWLVLLLGDLPNTRVIMHAKLGPYLASGTPILAVVPEDSYVAEVITACRVGVVVPPGEGAGKAIARLLLDPPADRLAVDDAQVRAFSLEAFHTRWRTILNVAGPKAGARA